MNRFIFILIGLLCLGLPSIGWAAPKVMATIAPLHSIASAVMEDVGEPELLMKPSISPHGYSLKPSDIKRLQETDLLVMVSDDFESFLTRPLTSLKHKPVVLAMDKMGGMLVLKNRDKKARSHARTSQVDTHLWLDVENMISLTRELANTLCKLDKAHEKNYLDNANRYIESLRQTDASVKERLAEVAGLRFVVFHDAFQYFENRYNLTSFGIVAPEPEQSPGARHIEELRKRIRSEKVACLFYEPQLPSKMVEKIASDESVKLLPIDALGAALSPGKELYPALIESITQSYIICSQSTNAS